MSFIKVENGSCVNIKNCIFEGLNGKNVISCDATSTVNIKENIFKKSDDVNIDNKFFKIHTDYKNRGKNSKCKCGSNKKQKDCCLKIIQKLNLNESKNICLVIGNGFNISARNYLKDTNQELELNTADFFNWEIESISKKGECLIDDFPILKKYLDKVEYEKSFEKVQELNDFASKILKENLDDNEANILICELKYYITIAFSNFQIEFQKKDISQWSWVRVLKLMKDKLSYIISFNYELVLENALKKANIPYRRVGLYEEDKGIAILKPHGSIDFDVLGINVPLSLPINSYKDRNDMPIRKIEENNLITRRCECDIILPLEESYQKEYQWIKPGYDELNKYGNQIDNLIICGMSYWECDKEEIDYILDSTSKDAFITIVNKVENPELIKKIYSKFDKNKVQTIDLDRFINTI
nr:hypothetical protein [uncultured Intestinibacter sp.]